MPPTFSETCLLFCKNYSINNIALLILAIVTGIIYFVAPPYIVEIFEYEYDSLSYPLVYEYVNFLMLLLFAIFFPILIFIILYFAKTFDYNVIPHFFSGLFETLILTGLITHIIKLIVGRPRPNFLAMCEWSSILKKCTNVVMEPEARVSFPSGHASLAFASVNFLLLFLQILFPNLKKKNLIYLLIFYLPYLLPTMISATRTWNYYHHYDDVLAGTILGCLISYQVYRYHAESLKDEASAFSEEEKVSLIV